jgi:hypothetical protein
MRRGLLVSLCLAAGAAGAVEGMWPLNLLPQAALREHGLQPQTELLQRASVQLPYGSGSFVSPEGLVLTNHHVISECVDALSTARAPLQQRGFVAASRRAERRCPGVEVQVLQGIDDVSAELLALAPAERSARVAELEGSACPAGQRCRVVPLYGGALPQRYRTQVWSDVRLVMAPEMQAANFGGDDDNFNYPRFAFDFALLRVYEADGRPHRPSHWLRPAKAAARDGDALMVPGHPYRTERGLTVTQLETLRDAVLPATLEALDFELALLASYAGADAEAARQVAELRATLENSRKSRRGALDALLRPGLLQAKSVQEQQVRAAAPSAEPWEAAARSALAEAQLARENVLRQLPGGSQLAGLVDLLALRAERQLPEADRLPAYRGAAAQELLALAGADQRYHPDLEQARLSAYVAWVRQQLDEDNPWAASLEAVPASERWARGSDRLALLEASDTELAQDADAQLQLALRLVPLHRAWLRRVEAEVQAPLTGAPEAIAQARWKLLGASQAPDATFSLRLSFGRARGITSAGLRHPWQTNFGGLYARADAFDGQPPFDLAPRVAQARGRINARTPLNFIATADIVGGNSGSPVLNSRHEWVGLAFDGNLDSLAGDYHYDEASNRMVALHQRAIREALTKIYPAAHLARELGLQP